MLRIRFLIMLGVCFLGVSAAWADDVGYVDCSKNADGTQIFAKPRKTPEVLATVPCGERFTILVYGFYFSRIQTKDGQVGFIYSSLIAVDRGVISLSPAAQQLSQQTPSLQVASEKTKIPRTPPDVVKPTGFPPAPPQTAAVQPALVQAASAQATPVQAIGTPAPNSASPVAAPSAAPSPANTSNVSVSSASEAAAAQSAPAAAVAQPNTPAAADSQPASASSTPAQPSSTPATTAPLFTAPVTVAPAPPQADSSNPADASASAAGATPAALAQPQPTLAQPSADPAQPAPASPAATPATPAAPAIRPADATTSWEKPLPSIRRAPLLELYGGYAFTRFAGTPGSNLNGAMGSFGWNAKPWLQVTGDTTYSFETTGNTKNVIYGNHYGPRFFYRVKNRWGITPFGEALIGGSRLDTTVSGTGGYTASQNIISYKVGGGIDFHPSHRWDVRVLDVDYYRTSFGTNLHQSNYWISSGVVLRLFGGSE
jgi:opacity protein-like surface antigen